MIFGGYFCSSQVSHDGLTTLPKNRIEQTTEKYPQKIAVATQLKQLQAYESS